jgi:uncharacterized protein
LLVKDLLAALSKPGRDPREDLPPPVFRRGIVKLEDLKPGMELSGTVLNVVDFGAFVDIGISDSALVHISHLADRFIKDPHDVVSVGDTLHVWVLSVDRDRRRVSLSALDPKRARRTSDEGQPSGSQAAAPSKQRRDKHKRRQRTAAKQGKGGRTVGQYARPRNKPKPRPAKPITPEMVEGSEPMRSFSDLLQFYEHKKRPSDKDAPQDE